MTAAVAGRNPQINLAVKQAILHAGTSFILGFVVSSLMDMDPWVGLVGGTLSAAASLIDSVARPILNRLFNDVDFRNSNRELLFRSVIVLSVLAPLAAALAPLWGVSRAFDATTFIIMRWIWERLNALPIPLNEHVYIVFGEIL